MSLLEFRWVLGLPGLFLAGISLLFLDNFVLFSGSETDSLLDIYKERVAASEQTLWVLRLPTALATVGLSVEPSEDSYSLSFRRMALIILCVATERTYVLGPVESAAAGARPRAFLTDLALSCA
jgi:hypothetical protein